MTGLSAKGTLCPSRKRASRSHRTETRGLPLHTRRGRAQHVSGLWGTQCDTGHHARHEGPGEPGTHLAQGSENKGQMSPPPPPTPVPQRTQGRAKALQQEPALPGGREGREGRGGRGGRGRRGGRAQRPHAQPPRHHRCSKAGRLRPLSSVTSGQWRSEPAAVATQAMHD